ncbi:MAG TPA: PAS domain-containing sensor histidine kinase, partial [Telluria sp.]|nr:PAS domain-containing sensor histidine kinase [Telluria sp.]
AYFGAEGGGRAGRRATDYAVTGVRAGGETFPLEGSISSSREDGKAIYTIILRDVTARQQVQEKLSRSHAQLRQLSAALQTIREEERAHIARELHDDLGQLLASLRMDLALLQQEAAAGAGARRIMSAMEANLLTAIASLRRIATNLRPRALDEGGLYFALQGLRDEFVERHGIPCALYADEAELRLDDGASTAIFRIVQEALTNIARHAGASNVTMNLYRIDSQLLITIRDDGRGIAAADMEKAQSLGLIGMRERVWAMHGEITISGDDPPGTRIDIVLPLPEAARQE